MVRERLEIVASDGWLVASKTRRRSGDSPSRPGRDKRRMRRAQRREGLQKKERCENSELPLANDARGKEEIPKWNDWSYQRRGGTPLFLRM